MGILRHNYWEGARPLPRMPWEGESTSAGPEVNDYVDNGCEPPSPDLSSCLIHQKLQMLQLCIHRCGEVWRGALANKECLHLDTLPSYHPLWETQEARPRVTQESAEPHP